MNEPLYQAAAQVTLFCRMALRQKLAISIRPSDMGVLLYLDSTEEEVTPAAVSSFMGISRPCTTALLKRLERAGYISRPPSPSDGRCYSLALTGKGHRMLSHVHEEYGRIIQDLKDQMGNERFSLFLEMIEESNEILRKNL